MRLRTPLDQDDCEKLNTGDMVLLTGTVYTGRDTAHKRLYDAILQGRDLPINLSGQTMFYAAPTPTKPGRIIGSMGPTTSYRMDSYTPKLLEHGLKGMIGKGKRTENVRAAIQQYKAMYFGAMGGVAALLSRCITSAEVVAYEDLGPEAIMCLTIVNFPLVVINDTRGRDLYEEALYS